MMMSSKMKMSSKIKMTSKMMTTLKIKTNSTANRQTGGEAGRWPG